MREGGSVTFLAGVAPLTPRRACSARARGSQHVMTPDEFAATRRAAEDFERAGGLGEALQARLLEHQRERQAAGESWLEAWWLRKGYLEWRVPLPINSNWQLTFADHPAAAAGGPVPPTLRAAGLIRHALAFKRQIDECVWAGAPHTRRPAP